MARGEVTERTFSRMVAKPDWGIQSVACEDGRDHLVQIDTVLSRTFGDLIHFGARATMGQLEETAIQRVGFKYMGVGRLVYPGLLQLVSFISMNSESLFGSTTCGIQGQNLGP